LTSLNLAQTGSGVGCAKQTQNDFEKEKTPKKAFTKSANQPKYNYFRNNSVKKKKRWANF